MNHSQQQDTRPVTYARLSITEQCNLKCIYCRPSDAAEDPPRNKLRSAGPGPVHGPLSPAHAAILARAAASIGVERIRVTGGEPLTHPDVAGLVRAVAAVPGIREVSLTTNGVALAHQASKLAEAGLTRINVSLDSLNHLRFRRITGCSGLDAVLAGLDAAAAAGLRPIKINVVAMRGINDDEIPAFAALTLERDIHVRFIEVMPLGNPAFYCPDLLLPAADIRAAVERLGPLEPASIHGAGPARAFRFPAARGTVGFIAPMTDCFCASCNRIRLTSNLKAYACLASDVGVDLAPAVLANDVGSAAHLMRRALAGKGQRHGMSSRAAGVGCRISRVGG